MNAKDQTEEDKVRIWVNYEASMALSGCVKRFHKNKTFISNLEEIFGHLCKKFEILCNFQRSFHFFINQSLPEAHLLLTSNRGGSCEYKRLEISTNDYNALKDYTEKKSEEEVIPPITELNSQDLSKLLRSLRINDNIESTTGLLIPFNYREINMGVFVLWKQDNPERKIRDSHDEALRGWVASYYSFLQSFLTREYALFPETYLPSYYSARWAKAAILFADIRNFTPLTEILRNIHARLGDQKTEIFRDIINEYCREMARIIQEGGRGRIDKFLGDGVMAIFGEHESNPSKAVCRAVYAATQMVERFRELKSGFLKKAFGGGYEIEYNESVEIDLGVGINYGTVLFEYLGDDRHREYTAVGDHVNFAQRLELEAARVDERTNEPRPPILISQTAKRCILPWLNEENVMEIILHPKGKGQFYKVYGMYPKDFHRGFHEMAEKQNDWKTPWNNYKCGSPEIVNVPLDSAMYLKERSQAEEFLEMQIESKAYQDWLSPENDIYDEVFKDELQSR